MLVPASHVAGNTSLHWCTHLQMKDNSWCCKLSQSLLTFQTVWYIVRSSSFQPNPRWRCPCSRCWWGRRPRSWNTRSYTPPWCGHCIGLKHSNFFLRTWSLAYDNLICYSRVVCNFLVPGLYLPWILRIPWFMGYNPYHWGPTTILALYQVPPS